MLQEYARLARPYFVLLAIFAVGRWLLGSVFHVPYEKGTWYLSIVMLTLYASLFSGAFSRRWLGFRLPQAAGLAMFMAFASQLVILASTVISYAFGISSYYGEPIAINRQTEAIAFAPAVGFRLVGVVVNTLLNGIIGALGWALGGLLPERPR
jgi:hypothetical protein